MREISQWAAEGLCRQNQLEFDKKPRSAKRLCSQCPVANECFMYGMIYNEWGIWGGTTRRERMAMIKASPQLQQNMIREAVGLGIYEARYTIAQDYRIEKKETENFLQSA